MDYKKIENLSDVIALFPKTPADVQLILKKGLDEAQEGLDKILKVQDRTFENTARALDIISANFSSNIYPLHIIEMVSPIKTLRDACHEAVIKAEMFAVDAFHSKELYSAFQSYLDNASENLNDEQQYYLDETLKDFKRSGLNLPDDKLEEVKSLKKQISQLDVKFSANINQDASFVTVSHDGLRGLDQEFIDNLKKEGDLYKLTCDYPTYLGVMGYCKVADTRKKLYLAFSNRAHPENTDLLREISTLRDQLARKLGFNSYADFHLDSEMVKTVPRAEKFILDLIEKSQDKALHEVDELVSSLPDGVTLNDGKLESWDVLYVKEHYKKNHFELDERKIAEYFPMDKTVDALFDIYQKFFSLKFNIKKPDWSWHEDVSLVEVYKGDKLRGYIFLDLYPRENKYSHACHAGFIDSLTNRPSAAVVIANFPKPTADKPSLLKYDDVSTFFHEFGHAMHAVLGNTELASFSGTSTTIDFVEMPSQMFEEWLWDKETLKNVSSHYQTGESLPDELIDKMIELKTFDSGYLVLRQCILSLISLYIHKDDVDPTALVHDLNSKYMPKVRVERESHMAASFGHLMGYGARYYGYMWSRVFAHDLFENVKKLGLLNPKAGDEIVSKVLGKGGSRDANMLLEDYLGRKPSQEAFLKNYGLL